MLWEPIGDERTAAFYVEVDDGKKDSIMQESFW